MPESCSGPSVCTQELAAHLKIYGASLLRCALGYRCNNIICLITGNPNMNIGLFSVLCISCFCTCTAGFFVIAYLLSPTHCVCASSPVFVCLAPVPSSLFDLFGALFNSIPEWESKVQYSTRHGRQELVSLLHTTRGNHKIFGRKSGGFVVRYWGHPHVQIIVN